MNKIIFFDFDGVIKESLDVKSAAFVKLFEPYGEDIGEQVRRHHELNGGMSRFEKFPLYLSWAGLTSTETLVNQLSDQFSESVFKGVVSCDWVPGVCDYIKNSFRDHTLVIVSATPQKELEGIVEAIQYSKYFTEIFGSPTSKRDAIKLTLEKYGAREEDCLMIGDAHADLMAAEATNVPFLLRRHKTNAEIFQNYKGLSINDFLDL